jgi:murein DD-endopeptidase MepM/ murein hydrolase activator NlpD
MPPVPHHAPLRRTRIALACAGLLAVAAPAAIAAATDAPTEPAPAAAMPTGGLELPGRPQVSSATCARQEPWTCARRQVLTLRGSSLAAVRAVVFEGTRKGGDELRVRVRSRAARRGDLLVVVPRRARSGPLTIVSTFGHRVRTEQALDVREELPATDDAGGMRELVAGGRRKAVFGYETDAPAAALARVEAVRVADGEVVRSWALEPGPDGSGEVRWDGFVGDQPARAGTYVLRLAGTPGAARIAQDADREFELLEGLFPIRGRHVLARSQRQRFGGLRGHQGTDNFAACGTPLAAYTKGVVQFTGTHAAAGNYVVVRRPGGGSYAYMHLRDAPQVDVGDRVFAGQRLGNVGSTGRASECHLHFELWSAPGWQRGGSPLDPGPLLRRLDAGS